VTLSLDPKVNPLIALYGLFDFQGVQTRDDPSYLGVKSLNLNRFKAGPAKELIKLLRGVRPGVGAWCDLSFKGRNIINFATDFIWDWFNWSLIDQLAEKNELCADCYEGGFQDWKSQLDEDEAINQPPDEKDVEEYLSLLDFLLECHECGEHYSLDARVEKRSSVKEFLLSANPDMNSNGSGMLWHSPDTLQRAFGTFEEFLEEISSEAEAPLALFFFRPVDEYLGDYFKVLTLGDAKGDFSIREQAISNHLAAFTPGVLAEYRAIRKKYLREARPGEGDKHYLTPAFFLSRQEHLADYPQHALFTSGPLRSVIIYSVLAWLAEITQTRGDVTTFELPAGNNKTSQLTLSFGSGDVQISGGGIFDKSGWENLLGLLAYETGQCIGNKHFRESWSSALASPMAGSLNAQSFFDTLGQVRSKAIELMREPAYVTPSASNAELYIFLDSATNQISFELTTEAFGYRKSVGSIKLGSNDKDLPLGALNMLARMHMQSLTRDLELGDELPGADSYADLPRMHVLETKGRLLWRKLIPDGLKAVYQDLRDQQNLNIFIVSEDPSFPWELVMPYQPAAGLNQAEIKDKWWALKFKLARWITGSPYPTGEIVVKGVCCMAANSALPSALAEVNYLTEFSKQRAVTMHAPKTRSALLQTLKEQDYGILHLACHGQYNEERPGESAILLPDGKPLEPDDLYGEIETAFIKNRPLVFLNACHSGRTGPTLTGIEGWAKTFIEMGCGAFIGCGWEVSDTLASQFAVEFYKAFSNGKRLAEAIHYARQKIYEQNPDNSTWLAYYLYGNPECKLAT
jgi:hypothetical protein